MGNLQLRLPARQRRREIKHALLLQRRIAPYLQRKASESEIPVELLNTGNLDAVVSELARVAQALTEHERLGLRSSESANVAIADTEPLRAEHLKPKK
jgi:hypothetical protein